MTVTVREWRLGIEPPADFLTANSRKDRRGDSDRSAWRAAGWRAARQARLPTGLARVRIDIVIEPPDLRTDVHNYDPTCKALVDGLGPPFIRKPSGKSRGAAAPGYGLLPNDNRRHLDGHHMHVIDPRRPRGHVTVYIVDLSEVVPGRTWTPAMAHGPWKRVRVKRACNGCGGLLGDVDDDEIAAAFAGRPQPDVRAECRTCVKEIMNV